MDPLTQSLLDLLHELRDRNFPLTIGGGFGLFLKRMHLDTTGQRTLFARLPSPRATNDLDLFIPAEQLASLERTRELEHAIRNLGYLPVAEAKFLQWKRRVVVGGVEQEVKIDLLVGPLGDYRDRLKLNSPPVRPKGEIRLHAHAVEEAIQIDSEPLAVALQGQRTGGEIFRGTVFVPQAFPYLMMKLSAFGDRKDDARHHALDAYMIVGMMTEQEYDAACGLGRSYADDPRVQTVREIVNSDFSSPTGLGVLRLLEHPLSRPDFALADFIGVLSEIFQAA